MVLKWHLILVRTGQRGSDQCGSTILEMLDVRRDRAFTVERSEAERESVRCQRTWPIHDVEVQVGRVGVAAVAQQTDSLAARDVLADPNPDGARL